MGINTGGSRRRALADYGRARTRTGPAPGDPAAGRNWSRLLALLVALVALVFMGLALPVPRIG